MKKIRSKSNFLVWSGLIVALVLIYGLLNIPGKEGFNPSDDGVVLAQSYRILQGEIPHAGFISIRPVGSAILHLLNFLSPFPLEWSSRWFVLIEYFLYSLFLTLSLKNISGLRSSFKEHPFLLPFLTLAVFVLNQNHYNLFPWTTIDALLWISIASYGFTLKPDHRLRGVLVVLGSVLAACSRQTFLLPGVVLAIIWFAGVCKRRAWHQLLPALVIGLIPVGVYLGVLIRHHAVADFIRQMTGRTELWDTGVVAFWYRFWHSPLLFFLILWSGRWFRTNLKQPVFGSRWISRYGDKLLILIYLLLLWSLAFIIFIHPRQLFRFSYELFYLLFFIWLLTGRDLAAKHRNFNYWVLWMLLIAWTSALSLGDNAPVFSVGLLFGTGWIMGWILLQEMGFHSWSHIEKKWFPLSAIALLVISIPVQMSVNYRDLPASQLRVDAGKIFQGLGNIRTNTEIGNYLQEIKRLYRKFQSPKGHFVVWPDNALIYALLDSPDPFPLDWMQADEFVGCETRLMHAVETELTHAGLVILVEKYSVKWLSTKREPLIWEDPEYPYLQLLKRSSVEIPDQSEFFRVFVTPGLKQ